MVSPETMPQTTSPTYLSEIVLVSGVPPGDVSREVCPVLLVLQVRPGPTEGVGEIVGSPGLVIGDSHRTVSLVGPTYSHCLHQRLSSLSSPGLGSVGTVDWDLIKVGPQPVAVGVVVREQPALQHLVRAGLDARHQVGRTEGNLLHLSEVVGGVPVENDPTNWDERELSMGPHLGQVEGVEGPVLSLLECHDLDVEGPGGKVPLSDGVVEVPDGVVRVGLGFLVRLVTVEALDALVRLVVELAVDSLPLTVHQLEGV